MTPNPANLPALDQAIWWATTTYDRAMMDRTFAADLIDYGCNSTFYTRDMMLAAPNAANDIEAILHDIAVRFTAVAIALVTFVSEVRYPAETQWCNRSSVWDRSTGAWQIRFHQGTASEART